MNHVTPHHNQSNYLKRLLRLTVASLLFWLVLYMLWEFIVLIMIGLSYVPVSSLDISPFILATFFALIVFISGLPCQLMWLFLTAWDDPVNTDGNTVYVLIASFINGLCFSMYELARSNSTPISIAIVVTLLSVVCSLFGSYFILIIYQKLYGNR